MNSRELEILTQIEAGFATDDAAFADRLTKGPRLSIGYRLWLAVATAVGTALVMLFAVDIIFAILGYLVLVAAATSMLQHRRLRPAEEPPLETFHRFTGNLFRDTGSHVEMAD